MSKYLGLFNNREDVAMEFSVGSGDKYSSPPAWTVPADFPMERQIIVAAYEYEDYSGSAYVLFVRNGQLYEFQCSENNRNPVDENGATLFE